MKYGFIVISAVVSGWLLTLGFSPFDQAWAGWIFLLPLALSTLLFCRSWFTALWSGYLFGLSHFASSLFWITTVSVIGWAALCLYLACYFAIWTALWWWLATPLPAVPNSRRNFCRALAGASVWVILEWLRGTLFTGFPWNQVGVSQHHLIGLIQVAEFGGVLLLSWLLILANLTLALVGLRVWQEVKLGQMARMRWEFTLTLIIIGLAFVAGVRSLFVKPTYVTTLHYVAIQPNLPNDPWKPSVNVDEAMAKMYALSISGLSQMPGKTGLLIWPETPVGEELYNARDFLPMLKAISLERGVGWLLGSNMLAYHNIYNAALLYNAGDPMPEVYYKNHLVPFGEYTPLKKVFPFILKFTPVGDDFSAGETCVPLQLTKPDLKIAPLICFEDTLARQGRLAAGGEPDLFINMTNDGWFRESAAAEQHLHNAVFRTVEHRIPMLRVTNSGVTAEISERGVVRRILQNADGKTYMTGMMYGALPIPPRQETLYQRWGDWIVGLSSVLFFIIGAEQEISRGLAVRRQHVPTPSWGRN